MSNGLSQDEINALLQGAADLGADAGTSQPVQSADDNHTMTPEEIEALLNAMPDQSGGEESETAQAPEGPDYSDMLTVTEKDALGEIGNISMGTAATTLFSLLNHKVEITTPRVTVTTMAEMARQYPMPFVSVEVQYTVGLAGVNCLFLHENDVKIITDLMMGGDGTNTTGELGELHLSCIAEVMNQMVGSSSTSLAQMLSTPIDISPPRATQVRLNSGGLDYPFNQTDKPVVRISFTMDVEGLINSEIMQVMPIDFAKEMVVKLMGMGNETTSSAIAAAPAPSPQPAAPASQVAPPQMGFMPPQDLNYTSPFQQPPEAAAPPMQYPQQAPYGYPPQAPGAYPYAPPQQAPYGYPAYPQNVPYAPPQPQQQPVDVRPANFMNFGDPAAAAGMGENMDILLDVPLSVSVELGKSKKYIKDILDFNIGTIVVLDKMAGELVDVVVNGKLIAQGEVVIIDDNYGCRITDIVSPSKRINPSK